MRKIYIIFALLLAVCSMSAQSVSRSGNVFKAEKKTYVRDTLVTQYKYEDSRGNSYPIIVNKKTGSCYVCKLSKNNKFYRQYLNKDIKAQICKELNIKIKED